jgi:transposase
MQRKRRFTDEFKIAAVRRWEETKNFNAVGRELGVAPSLVRKWRDQLRDESEVVFPGKGHSSAPEMAQAKREIARLKEENTILKKAIGYFTERPR